MKVFLSYCREFPELFRSVRTALQKTGIEVLSDEELQSGQCLSNEIRTGISKSHGIVALITNPVVDPNRVPNWVADEIIYAKHIGRPVLPVLCGLDPRAATGFLAKITHRALVSSMSGGFNDPLQPLFFCLESLSPSTSNLGNLAKSVYSLIRVPENSRLSEFSQRSAISALDRYRLAVPDASTGRIRFSPLGIRQACDQLGFGMTAVAVPTDLQGSVGGKIQRALWGDEQPFELGRLQGGQVKLLGLSDGIAYIQTSVFGPTPTSALQRASIQGLLENARSNGVSLLIVAPPGCGRHHGHPRKQALKSLILGALRFYSTQSSNKVPWLLVCIAPNEEEELFVSDFLSNLPALPERSQLQVGNSIRIALDQGDYHWLDRGLTIRTMLTRFGVLVCDEMRVGVAYSSRNGTFTPTQRRLKGPSGFSAQPFSYGLETPIQETVIEDGDRVFLQT